MPSTTVTSKGRVTIPKVIRDRLNLNAGDQIDFVVTGNGDVVVRNASLDVRELRGLLKRRHSVSVEEMNGTIVRQAGRMRGRIRMARNFDAPLATFSIRRSEVQFGSLVGSTVFSPGNLVKSRSVVQTVAPCSMARAASEASVMSGPLTSAVSIRLLRISQKRSPGSISTTEGWASQKETISLASLLLSGLGKARGLVPIRRNARIDCQQNATESSRDNVSSRKVRQTRCDSEREL